MSSHRSFKLWRLEVLVEESARPLLVEMVALRQTRQNPTLEVQLRLQASVGALGRVQMFRPFRVKI
jgi:hypothetical protein